MELFGDFPKGIFLNSYVASNCTIFFKLCHTKDGIQGKAQRKLSTVAFPRHY